MQMKVQFKQKHNPILLNIKLFIQNSDLYDLSKNTFTNLTHM